MHKTSHFRSNRFGLTPLGYSTEAAYRSHIALARGRGPSPRLELKSARAYWALAHDLEPDDGPYLSEVGERALTLKQLGEALAICGQSREMVGAVVARLSARGFLEPVGRDVHRRCEPTLGTAESELANAEHELALARRELAHEGPPQRSEVGDDNDVLRLRLAISRVVVARWFLTSFLGPRRKP